ncbi:MAG TPA: YdcF family protein [Bryobacteraceae bacterium]|nr:YdcF family protein [Bryobacteraceae bacterium]
MKRLTWILALVVLAVPGARLWYVARQIRIQSSVEEARPADIILVLGAAEYRGRPSPVFKARLDHALDLFRRGLAPRILTTGGAGGDPQYTEGGVGRAYLVGHGVPSEAIVVEPEGSTTAQSTSAAAEIMRRMGLQSCILVSDGYHIFRAKRMLRDLGIRVHGSPRPSDANDGSRYWRLYLRQSVGYMLWESGIRF